MGAMWRLLLCQEPVSGDTNGAQDIFVKDLQTGTTKLISVASDGTQGNSYSAYPPSLLMGAMWRLTLLPATW
jgi:hypothetical protein